MYGQERNDNEKLYYTNFSRHHSIVCVATRGLYQQSSATPRPRSAAARRIHRCRTRGLYLTSSSGCSLVARSRREDHAAEGMRPPGSSKRARESALGRLQTAPFNQRLYRAAALYQVSSDDDDDTLTPNRGREGRILGDRRSRRRHEQNSAAATAYTGDDRPAGERIH